MAKTSKIINKKSKITKKPPIVMKRGVVVMLDVLGVKGIWSRMNSSDVIKKWRDIEEDFQDFHGLIKKDHADLNPKIQAFSDTIIITLEGKDDRKLLTQAAMHVMWPLCHGILNGIYLRGSISIGEFYQDKTIVIGPAIDEAVAWYEKYDWMGITLTPTANYTAEKLNLEETKLIDLYTFTQVPFNDGTKKSLWTINWPNELPEVMKFMKDTRNVKQAILESFSKSPSNSESFNKYQNSLDFYDKIIKKNN